VACPGNCAYAVEVDSTSAAAESVNNEFSFIGFLSFHSFQLWAPVTSPVRSVA
jgi:hypothetical protein